MLSRKSGSLFLSIFAPILIHGVVGLSGSLAQGASTPRSCGDLFFPVVDLEPILKNAVLEIDGRSTYFESIPAKKGQPTALLFMGLFTPMSDLLAFQREWVRQSRGEGLTIFTYSTQVESLIWRLSSQQLKFVNPHIEIVDLVREATAVANAAAITGPVTVIGYSYGSIVASRFAEFHKDRVANLIFAAPFVEAGEHHPQVLSAKSALETWATLNPFFGGGIMLENAREHAAQSMAKQIVDDYMKTQKFPDGIEREDVIALLKSQIRAVEAVNLVEEMKPGLPKTTLIVAGKENTTRRHLQDLVAKTAEAAGLGGHVVKLESATHPVLADKPREAVEAVLAVIRAKP
ncbi:hypothetical protein BH10BDE1_BH10BDE1_07320 [soil metagenome]